MKITISHLKAAVTLAGALGCSSATAMAQSGGVLSADKSLVVLSTPTSVTFRLALPYNANLITTSPNLQRLGPTGWTVLDRLYDDGTHGDTTPGDNVFTLQLPLNEAQLGTISFRASTGYKGLLLRKFSNPLQLGVVEPLSLQVKSGSQQIYVVQGAAQNVVTTVTLANGGYGTVNVQNAATITPMGGVSMTSDYPLGGWYSAVSQSFVLNQSFAGLSPGDYVVVNTASIAGYSITASASFVVHVIPPGGDPLILPLGSDPDGVQIGVPTIVRFTATIANYLSKPTTLNLRLVDGITDPIVGSLTDDGEAGDLVPSDNVYSGTFTVSPASLDQLHLRVSADFPGVVGERSSDLYNLEVTCYPATLSPVDFSKVITDPATGDSFICDEVLVHFREGTACQQILQTVGLLNGVIIGSQPGLGTVQIRIPNGECSLQPVYAAVGLLLSRPEVESAKPNLLGVIPTEIKPNDSSYGSQYAPQKIRADEAWVIARGGGCLIAVVDSGVDYSHEDLSGKVIKGKDFISGDDDPMDEDDHGTHVAGIAAASADNSKGIAGIAWDSKVLAIRGVGGTYAALASGIKSAADNGAKVINISGGGKTDDSDVKKAVDYAVGKGCLVVSTPANLSQVSSGGNFYPGAYANVFCVGSTTSSDSLSSSSNPADYVDIVAPGENIYSCLKGGGYGYKSGVSMAAPCVSGAAAVVWGYFPAWTAAQVRQRLEKTAVQMTGTGTGAGRIDLFEAVFNGSFEDDVNGWKVTGTAGAVPSLGPLTPTDRKSFGFASSGPDNAQIQTTMEQSFTIQSGVTSFDVSFDYNFVTEEYPEWVGTIYNDNMKILLVTPAGTTEQLAFESVNTSSFSLVGGIDFPGGDNTVGQTGWKTISKTIPVTAGPGVYRIQVRDEGDGIYDSNVLVDRIRFKN